MNYFCTYCDQHYAARLICLHDSLLLQKEPFRLFVLCFDAATRALVLALGRESLIAISLEELMEADPEYAKVRGQRSRVEFYFTATPVLVRHCLHRESGAAQMTYLDSDLFFFGPASGVFELQGEASVGIVSHRFPGRLASLAVHGEYNVGWVSFRRDRDGMACLEWWRQRCLEWCHDHVDQQRYADQGYLNDFSKHFRGVRVLDHPGINAAPWNMDDVQVAKRDGVVWVNGRRLYFYHFQGVRELLPGWFEPGLRNYGTKLTNELRNSIYAPYLAAVATVQRLLRDEHGIVPRLGHQRLPEGKTWLGRRRRALILRLTPYYRRFTGELIPGATARVQANRSNASGTDENVRR